MSVATAELPGTDAEAEKVALVFPGQGSQYVGMGKALYEASSAARRVFQQADEVLGFKLSQLCFEGPAEELEDTINAQPAILTVSMACLAAIREKVESVGQSWQPPRFVAGHSLGEYTALVAAGVLDFADALRLVRERGARTVVPLRISIASHSPLMQQAAARLAELIDRSPLREPQVPVVTNLAGQVRTSAEHIRAELESQMVAPVEWVGSVREMVANGVDTFVEVGPGQVLSRLIKRISGDVRAISLNDAHIALLGQRAQPEIAK